MKPALITVMILSYRNLSKAYGTLDSVFRQDYPALELVLSDDASPDYAAVQPAVAAYVEAHRGKNIQDVRWLSHPENVGTVKNSNDAVRASRGEYIISLAPEDEFSSESALRDLAGALEESGRLVCFGRLQGVTPEGDKVDHLLSCESDYDLLKSYSVEQTRNRLFSRNFLPAPAALMARRVFDQYGLYPESIRLIEDYPYWLMLSEKGVPFAYLDRIVVYYRLSGVSSAGHYSEMFMADMFRIYEEFIFPFDRRFGPLQGIYNALKRHGLQFYLAKARWPKMSRGKRAWLRVRYAPFFAYTAWLDWKTARKNQIRKNASPI